MPRYDTIGHYTISCQISVLSVICLVNNRPYWTSVA